MKKLLCICILLQTCLTFSQEKMETLKIVWPDENHWKIGSNQETQQVHLVELVPGKETIERWTIMGTMMSMKGVQNIPVNDAMNMMFDQAKNNSANAKLTFIEMDDKAAHPWIIFKIEASSFKDDPNPESQLYYIIQGTSSLYSNFVAIKKKELKNEFLQKWIPIFKQSELVYE